MTEQPLGIFQLMPSDVYHSAHGISFTGYKAFIRSPLHYRAYRDLPRVTTPSQLLGQLNHCMALEPELVAKRFVRVGKRASSGLKDEAKEKGLIAVNDTTWETAARMADAVHKHEDARILISTGSCEVSGFWEDPQFGVVRKCRPDIYHAGAELIADLKYVGDASTTGFEKMCMRLKYHLQSAWYLDTWGGLIGKPLRRHVHITVEDEEPFAVQLHAISDHDLEQSRHSIQNGLARYAECVKKNEWPGYDVGVRELVLPHWAYQLTEEGEVIS